MCVCLYERGGGVRAAGLGRRRETATRTGRRAGGDGDGEDGRRAGDDGAAGRATTGAVWGDDDGDWDGLGRDRGGDGGEEQTETN